MEILLVTATLLEMRAVLAGLCPPPEAEPLLAVLEKAPAGETVPLFLPGGSLRLLICGIGPVAAGLSLGFALGRLCGPVFAEPAPTPVEQDASQPSDEQTHPLLPSPELKSLGERRMGVWGKEENLLFKGGFPPSPTIRGVLNFGLAGTYDAARAPLGSVVLATEEIWPEYGLATEKGVDPQGIGFAQTELDGVPVFGTLPLAPQNALGNMGLNCHNFTIQGASVTVAGVSGSPALAAAMAAHTRGLTENMEGFALALGAARAGLPFAEVRAVSNEVGFRPPERWDSKTALAVMGEAAQQLFRPLLRNRQGRP